MEILSQPWSTILALFLAAPVALLALTGLVAMWWAWVQFCREDYSWPTRWVLFFWTHGVALAIALKSIGL